MDSVLNKYAVHLYHRLCRLFRLRLLRVFLWITVESHTLWLWNLSVSACVYCGTPWNLLRYWSITETQRIIAYSPFVFSSYFLVNRLRRRLRLLRNSWECPWILILACFIYTPPSPAYITETLRIIVYSHLVFSSYLLVNRLRRRLR